MFRKGSRLFFISYVLLLVVAGLHSMGSAQPWPTDEKTTALVSAMRGYAMDMMGRATDVLRVYKSLSWTMSILLVALALTGIVGLATAPENRRLHRSAGFVTLSACSLLAALYWRAQVMPPCISFVVVSLVLLVALALSARAEAGVAA